MAHNVAWGGVDANGMAKEGGGRGGGRKSAGIKTEP